ncbi:MAG: thioredoxin-dependent thiol peroxidase [Erysipelotrichaceae bacterium]|nr:thioredoxin-dependent thiol peroxidase [Erysipelotrichaceae bacterium]
MLETGQTAIDFTLYDQENREVSLSDFKGKKIVLYFYPKDMTSGCTKQACAFAAAYEEFKKEDIMVIGISKDSTASHQKFATKYELPFLLLADPELKAITAYDVWKEKKLYGRTYMGVMRSTYIIDEHFTIIKVFEKANPASNAQDILAFLAQPSKDQ